MKLIKNLGIKTWRSNAGKKQSATFGLFECPVCKIHTEKRLVKGYSAKSCGSRECRREVFALNKNSVGNKHKNKASISSEPFYDVIRKKYEAIATKAFTLKEFYNHISDQYSNIRISHPSATIMSKDGSNSLSSFVAITQSEAISLISKNNAERRIENNIYDTNALSVLTGKSIGVIKTAVRKYNLRTDISDRIDISNILDVTHPTIRNKKTKSIILTKSQYNALKHIVMSTNKISSNKLYFIEHQGAIKIGITSNIEARLQTLRASSIHSYSLITYYEIDNAIDVEKYLHATFKSVNIHYEWFNLTDNELKNAMDIVECTLDGKKWLYPSSKIFPTTIKHTTPKSSKLVHKEPVQKSQYDIDVKKSFN
jgi:hypothetical protein